jgi:hypothetical protein
MLLQRQDVADFSVEGIIFEADEPFARTHIAPRFLLKV